MNIKKLEFNAFLLWSFFACTASAAEIYHNINGLQVIVWWQPQTLQLAYEYRPRHDIIITNMEARLHDTILSPVSRTDYPYEGVSSAILFLVDISDPRRRRVVTKNAEQIKSMLEKAEPHHKFGLAGFATEMRILARLGTPSSEVAAAADTLQANGRTTELYRHALGAVNLLLKFPARRRALFLFSDGKAEDTTYFHKDIINAANSKNVTIYGFGYATSAANSVHMQSLRRLSEETNGMFIEAEKNFSLPAIFLSAPYRMLDTGEHIIYDLMPAVQGGFYGKQKVRITWHGGAESLNLNTDITLPPPPPPEPDVKKPPPAVKKAPPPKLKKHRFEYLFFAGTGLLLTILLLWLWFRNKARKNTASETIHAHFDLLGNGETRFPMMTSTLRIGRHGDNELCLNNTSVSSHHAEVHLRRDGRFILTDLDSTNGVAVNDKLVKSAELTDGDKLEIGEIHLMFSKY